MGLNDLAAQAGVKGAGKSNGVKGKDQVGLSRKIANQIKANGLGQAQLIVKSKDDAAFTAYRGNITISLESKTYNLEKGDTHTVWYSHQDTDGGSQFEQLFNTLEERLPPGDNAKMMLDCIITFGDSPKAAQTAEVETDDVEDESDDDDSND